MATDQQRKSTRFSRWRTRRREKAQRATSRGRAAGSSACLLSVALASDAQRVRNGR